MSNSFSSWQRQELIVQLLPYYKNNELEKLFQEVRIEHQRIQEGIK